MTSESAGGLAWSDESRGVAFEVLLDRGTLLPGRLATGRVSLAAGRDLWARAVVVTLIGTEHWRHRVTRHDANGNTRTEVVTSRAELRRVPVNVHGPLRLERGERWSSGFEIPVPPMGPASLVADDAGLEWRLEAKLDIDDAIDARTERPVIVVQPIALLRAGAVRVGQFAQFERVDVASGDVTGTIALDPVPLVCGRPFEGQLEVALPAPARLQEIRAELRVAVEATVSEGEREAITAWAGQVAPPGDYAGTVHLEIAGAVGPRPLPTIELPHGRASATFHVVLAEAWARDTHLVRDVAIATTDEL